ncbi:AmmeMemoRadiSam system radical SAM enzyme [Soehngenia longivitae]|uniref:AmmeMemoRadiSam system radical SAM enzyme n=1 Tax=Soehngenia longivitae TaxID=2562294 RepID=A0A4Z0D976_9FIRM|nr:AmmeMemoRadiSam system radical SAM enzyme [Soehngenia longivitae]TFZ41405.1 AmmeMemoRadiSam system radical SAM enzyme [Soehngenia longivitae]
MKEAKFYENKGDYVICKLCPHNCKIKNGSTGICKVRKNIDGVLYSTNYEKITSIGLDPIEKKPLYHFYPGTKIFSIGSFGCNFRCDYCQNYEIVEGEALAIDLSIEKIIQLEEETNSIGMAFTYNEPTIFYEMVEDLAKEMRNRGKKNVLVTNGFINKEPLTHLLPLIDAMNIDLKAMSDDFYKKICKGKLDPVLETIKLSATKTHVEVTTLLIDEYNTSEEEIERLSYFLSNIDKDIVLHFSRYFPKHKMNNPATNLSTLTKAKEIAKKHLNYVYIGNVFGFDNSTYCPYCNSKLIDRNFKTQIVGIEKNRCSHCGQEIPIIY